MMLPCSKMPRISMACCLLMSNSQGLILIKSHHKRFSFWQMDFHNVGRISIIFLSWWGFCILQLTHQGHPRQVRKGFGQGALECFSPPGPSYATTPSGAWALSQQTCLVGLCISCGPPGCHGGNAWRQTPFSSRLVHPWPRLCPLISSRPPRGWSLHHFLTPYPHTPTCCCPSWNPPCSHALNSLCMFICNIDY